jgi:hypothetical protein
VLKGTFTMKIVAAKYAKMLAGMRAVVDHLGGPAVVNDKAHTSGFSETRSLWDLWHIVSDNLKYDDSHPWFISGRWTRLIPQDATFDVYSDGANDSHIETALKRIAKELRL